MTLVYQCTVSVIIPRYTVFGRILVTLTLALNKAKTRNTRPRPRPRPEVSSQGQGQKIWPRGQGQGQGLTTLTDRPAITEYRSWCVVMGMAFERSCCRICFFFAAGHTATAALHWNVSSFPCFFYIPRESRNMCVHSRAIHGFHVILIPCISSQRNSKPILFTCILDLSMNCCELVSSCVIKQVGNTSTLFASCPFRPGAYEQPQNLEISCQARFNRHWFCSPGRVLA